MKKKLLFIADNLEVGGVEKSLVSLLNCLDYRSYDVDLLLFEQKGMFLNQVPENVNILTGPEYIKFFQISKKGVFGLLLKALIAKGPIFTVIFLSELLLGLKNKNMGIARQKIWTQLAKKFPVFKGEYDAAIGFSGGLSTYFMIDKVSALKKIAWVHLDYRMLKQDDHINDIYFKKCTNIVTVSPRCGQILNEVFPELKEKIKVMYNIVSPKLINELAKGNTSLWDNKDKSFKILTIGRISTQKGLDLAIPALSKLVNEGYDIKWYILGEGPEKESIIKKINEYNVKDSFVLLGTTENPYPYIKNTDIYAQPSRFEGKAIAIDEAKILCKPILVTDFSTVTDQIKNKENGIIIPMSSEGIYRGLKDLVNNPAVRDSLNSALLQENVGNEDEIQKFYSYIT